MIELNGKNLRFSFPELHQDAVLSIQFQRTLRLPDDGKMYPLPPGLGAFPLKHVDDYSARIPAAWREHGGVMLPMFQSEALWINFTSQCGYPMLVKIATGKINAVTGEQYRAGAHRDDGIDLQRVDVADRHGAIRPVAHESARESSARAARQAPGTPSGAAPFSPHGAGRRATGQSSLATGPGEGQLCRGLPRGLRASTRSTLWSTLAHRMCETPARAPAPVARAVADGCRRSVRMPGAQMLLPTSEPGMSAPAAGSRIEALRLVLSRPLAHGWSWRGYRRR